jgi:hypothetical protein
MSNRTVTALAELVGGPHDGRLLDVVPHCQVIYMPEVATTTQLAYVYSGRRRTLCDQVVRLYELQVNGY